MAYSQEVLARAQARLAQARQEQQDSYDAHLREAYRRYPRLKEIDCALRTTMAEVVAATFRRGEDPAAAIAAIKAKNQALQEEREWILESSDLDTDFLDDTPFCPKCGGSGYIGSQMCECLHALCRAEQKKELSSLIGSGKERFSAFRLDYYPTRPDPNWGLSPRAMMENNLAACKTYAATFSRESASLLFSGLPGLGKTFLSACIARTVADRGFSVVYETAIKIIADHESVKFGAAPEEARRSLDKYTACDLLIIDDLGTEMNTQYTQSVIYMLLNDRLIKGLPTIVSTNLDTAGIRDRYTPQTVSRLIGTFELLRFLGDDIRLRGKI
ncbi:MAG: ATP-binding protein [Oscillospiraceae bacterium]|nr:ATP-binding protein [Oscillospiraceae bacterium]